MVEVDFDEAIEIRELKDAPDEVFPKGTTITPLSGPIRKGEVQDQEGLSARKYYENGAKRQKVAEGKKVWRSINTVELRGGRVEGAFKGGCLFQVADFIIGTPTPTQTERPETIIQHVKSPTSTKPPWWNE